ncbi:hypothetical protein [Urbanus proteus nucleopolyhedrovirus]|uniref:Uncharacterized protein n=1 Tax=Urbanus proteus nucleopolyhedrovirus TaxID=1675866 RepID=A0A161C6X4_9ABAC|nr:hypothetical protein [Urbanus proteus nucleopolyhedrovirus]AKR17342.2 hypothetical protein [Urbanus proteus nucleopolyhedrovirus]
MSKNKLLLTRKRDEDFNIDDTIELSEESRQYLNALQTEKLYHCRLCYHKNEKNRCDFHKKYIFDKDQVKEYDAYVNFLNSEMGIISFVELYYTYLAVDFWSHTASILFKDLTSFKCIKDLLHFYNYSCDDNVDILHYTTMDFDDE